MLFFATTIDGLQMGLCFAVLALGVYISYSILDFPDLSVDGTFPLGGVICTILMLKLGIPALPAILLSFFAGLAAGAITGILHVKFNIYESSHYRPLFALICHKAKSDYTTVSYVIT